MNSEKDVNPDYSFKILLLGDAFVGKTSLLIRFKDRTFLKGSYISTVGIDHKTKLVSCEGKLVKLQLWDTAGQERFRSITKSYYRDADAVVIVYDVTKTETFLNVKSWLQDLSSHAPSSTVVAIFGNKMDETGKRTVKPHDGVSLAAEHGALFSETSAKSGMNVELAFQTITANLIRKREGKTGIHSTENSNKSQDTAQKIIFADDREGGGSKKSLFDAMSSCC